MPVWFAGLPVPDYQLPFTSELGQHPSFEDMQMFVSKHKLRPSFPDVWKDTNQVKYTVVSCYNVPSLQRIHRYNVLFPRSRFQVMENSRSGYNVLSLQRTSNPMGVRYNATRLYCGAALTSSDRVLSGCRDVVVPPTPGRTPRNLDVWAASHVWPLLPTSVSGQFPRGTVRAIV